MNSTATSKVNVPLILLWVAAVALIGGGYWLLNTSTASQVAFYTSGSQDVAGLLGAQSSTTIAGLLIAAGALAVVIALAVHAVSHVVARTASTAAAEVESFDDETFDEEIVVAPAAAPVAPAAAEPVAPAAEPAAAAPVEDVAAEASAAEPAAPTAAPESK